MSRAQPYPPHLQRAIDAAESKHARRARGSSLPRPINTPAEARPRRGRMNKTEHAYSVELRARQLAGEVRWFLFECMKLRLADKAWYTPDFAVQLVCGRMEFHEVKGHMREAAAVRLKVAAELHPWARFVLVRADRQRGGAFTLTPIRARGEEAAQP